MKNESFANLVSTIAKIDGIGAKSALRIAYELAFVNKPLAAQLRAAIAAAAAQVCECSVCGAMASSQLCEDCQDPSRLGIIALVSSAKDVLFIKRAGGFEGRFFVLPAANEHYLLRLGQMCERFSVRELLLAHSPGVGADALCFYLENRFPELVISKIAQGVPQGIKLGDIDPLTLASAIEGKVKLD